MNKPPIKINTPAYLFIFLGFAGFLDASYLTAKHYLGGSINCFLTSGCDKIAASQYAVIFGIPTALVGAVYYLLILSLAVILADTKNQKILRLIFYLSAGGFFASLGFLYLQIFVIKSFCVYCLISAADSTLIFAVSLAARRYRPVLSDSAPDS